MDVIKCIILNSKTYLLIVRVPYIIQLAAPWFDPALGILVERNPRWLLRWSTLTICN
jgi:hypothetical protein